MQGADIEPGLGQMPLDVLAVDLGVAEHQRLRRLQLAEQLQQRVIPAVGRHLEEQLFDMFGSGIGIEQDFQRIVLIAFRQVSHAVRKGRREQQGLVFGGQGLPDGLDRRLEAHVEHAVGLIQHQRIHRVKLQGTGFDQLQYPARRTDHDGGFMHQGLGMHPHRDAAVERRYFHIGQAHGKLADSLGDLIGQLAGRAQHQGLHAAGGFQALQKTQREGQGLAAAGLGLRQYITAGQNIGQRGLLDRSGHGQALAGQRLAQFRAQRPLGEIRHRESEKPRTTRNRHSMTGLPMADKTMPAGIQSAAGEDAGRRARCAATAASKRPNAAMKRGCPRIGSSAGS